MNNGYFPNYDQFTPQMNGQNMAVPPYQPPMQRQQGVRQSYSPIMQAYQPTFLTNSQSNGNAGGVVWVLGEAEASSYLVAPGCEVVMMDSKAPMAYLKRVDENNRPNLRKFQLIEVFDEPPQMQTSSEQHIPVQDFVTREEYKKLVEDQNRLYEIIEKMAKQMKGVNDDDAE